MKIQFLGTGAFEGIPSLFCECEICKHALEVGGREIRTRSQALINDDLLIDFNNDTVSHFHNFKFDSTKIKNILVTHTHADHFLVDDLIIITGGYSQHANDKVVGVYGGQSCVDKVNDTIAKPYNNFGGCIEPHLVEHGKVIEVGKYKVLPIAAVHAPKTCPHIYLIDDGEKVILYGHDTGLFTDEMYEALKVYGKKIDLISLDCTFGLMSHKDAYDETHHMCLEGVVKTLARLEEMFLIDCNTIRVINHFTHNANSTHEQLVEEARKHFIVVAYDGMKVDF